MSKPFKMRGHELPGPNQRVSINPSSTIAGGAGLNAVTPPVETDPLEKQKIEQEVSGMQDNEKNELITKLVSEKNQTT